jgi:hypothetical protein
MMKMLGSVLVLRRVAAAHIATRHTQAQVNPCVAHFDALFADVRVRGCDFDLIEMLALGWHRFSPQFFSGSFQFLAIPLRKIRPRLIRALQESE